MSAKVKSISSASAGSAKLRGKKAAGTEASKGADRHPSSVDDLTEEEFQSKLDAAYASLEEAVRHATSDAPHRLENIYHALATDVKPLYDDWDHVYKVVQRSVKLIQTLRVEAPHLSNQLKMLSYPLRTFCDIIVDHFMNGSEFDDAKKNDLNTILSALPPLDAFYNYEHPAPVVFRQRDVVFIQGITIPVDLVTIPGGELLWWQPASHPIYAELQLHIISFLKNRELLKDHHSIGYLGSIPA